MTNPSRNAFSAVPARSPALPLYWSLALSWTFLERQIAWHGDRGIAVSRKRAASSACRRSRRIRMVRSDRDHGYSGPCRLFCKSDGRRASADLCWTSGRSCQSAELRRGSVCGTAGLQRLAALPETVARRPVSGLNPDPSSDSNPDCATSAQHLHSLRPTLHAASGPATLWRTPGTRCERGRRAARQSRSHRLATVPQTIADRSFLEQIAAQLESNLLSSGGLGVFERARCLHLALDAQYRAAANAALGSNL